MNATFRFLLTGALAVGAAVSGVLGELVGIHATLWVGGAFVSTAFLPVLLSPVRVRRELPEHRRREGPTVPTAPSAPTAAAAAPAAPTAEKTPTESRDA